MMVRPIVKIQTDDNDYSKFLSYEDEIQKSQEISHHGATKHSVNFINLDHLKDQMINLEFRIPQGESKMVGQLINAFIYYYHQT